MNPTPARPRPRSDSSPECVQPDDSISSPVSVMDDRGYTPPPNSQQPSTKRAKYFHLALLGLGAVFLAYLIWKIGAGEIWRQLTSLGWGLIPLVLAEGIAEMIHTSGWRHCLNEPYRSL